MKKLCNYIELKQPESEITQLLSMYLKKVHLEKELQHAVSYIKKYLNTRDYLKSAENPKSKIDAGSALDLKFSNYDQNIKFNQTTAKIEAIEALKCLHVPKNFNESFPEQFSSLKFDDDKMVAIAHPYNWIYKDTYRVIDAGGVYRIMDPILAPGAPPFMDGFRSIQKFGINKTLVQCAFLKK